MNKNYIDSDKLNALMTEVVAARDGKDALPTSKEEYLGRIIIELSSTWAASSLLDKYDEYVKPAIEEHFANAMILLLNMAWDVHGEKMYWQGYDYYGENFSPEKKYIENLWTFSRDVLNWGTMNITDSVAFIYAWAEHFNIEPDTLDACIKLTLNIK